jgi:hypothetical protein
MAQFVAKYQKTRCHPIKKKNKKQKYQRTGSKSCFHIQSRLKMEDYFSSTRVLMHSVKSQKAVHLYKI